MYALGKRFRLVIQKIVGSGILEKIDLFPFQKLGLTKNKTDIGYLAAKIRNDPKIFTKVLGVTEMVGLTDASSFKRHEQIKCATCNIKCDLLCLFDVL